MLTVANKAKSLEMQIAARLHMPCGALTAKALEKFLTFNCMVIALGYCDRLIAKQIATTEADGTYSANFEMAQSAIIDSIWVLDEDDLIVRIAIEPLYKSQWKNVSLNLGFSL